jgi:hypothetical protein
MAVYGAEKLQDFEKKRSKVEKKLRKGNRQDLKDIEVEVIREANWKVHQGEKEVEQNLAENIELVQSLISQIAFVKKRQFQMKKSGDNQKQQRTADYEEKKDVVVVLHVVQNVFVLRVLNPRHCYARMIGQ